MWNTFSMEKKVNRFQKLRKKYELIRGKNDDGKMVKYFWFAQLFKAQWSGVGTLIYLHFSNKSDWVTIRVFTNPLIFVCAGTKVNTPVSSRSFAILIETGVEYIRRFVMEFEKWFWLLFLILFFESCVEAVYRPTRVYHVRPGE